MRKIIYGPPGTGKTTAILSIIDDYFLSGGTPDRVGLMAFTRQAANEAKSRAIEKFGFKASQLPWFRTLHSMCFKQLGKTMRSVIGRDDLKRFGNEVGITIRGFLSGRAGYELEPGDRIMSMIALSREKKQDLLDTWMDDDWDLDWHEVNMVYKSYLNFKRSQNLGDFADMLEEFVSHGQAPDLDLLLIDEAQDISTLQWDVVFKLEEHAKNTIIAGDDDQAIFSFSGADVKRFIDLEGEKEVLSKSYRLPEVIRSFAEDYVKNINDRVEKEFTSRGPGGVVEYVMDIESVDMSKGSWLVLVRNQYRAEIAEEYCERCGYNYTSIMHDVKKTEAYRAMQTWESLRRGEKTSPDNALKVIRFMSSKHAPKVLRNNLKAASQQVDLALLKGWGLATDAIWHESLDLLPFEDRTYYLSCLRNGEKLNEDPRIRIDTIHGAKGSEAENVVLFTDMSKNTYSNYTHDPDSEYRCFYVGVTRAKNKLYIVSPVSHYYMDI